MYGHLFAGVFCSSVAVFTYEEWYFPINAALGVMNFALAYLAYRKAK